MYWYDTEAVSSESCWAEQQFLPTFPKKTYMEIYGNIWNVKEVFYNESGRTLEQVAQRGGKCTIFRKASWDGALSHLL